MPEKSYIYHTGASFIIFSEVLSIIIADREALSATTLFNALAKKVGRDKVP